MAFCQQKPNIASARTLIFQPLRHKRKAVLTLGTVVKALALLDLFSRAQPLIGLSDLSRLSGMNKATTHRMLGELQAQGFVEQAGSGREYRIGPAVVRLASLREALVTSRDVAQNVLSRLSQVTGETAHLSQVDGNHLSTFAHSHSSRHGTRVIIDDTEFLPFHATASGLAVLAFSQATFTDRVLNGSLDAFTGQTIQNVAEIRAVISRTRKDGFVTATGGFEADVHGTAVPVFDGSAACIGALAVATPVTRVTRKLQDDITQALIASANEIIDLSGGFVPDNLKEIWAHHTVPVQQKR